jgi:hypothetical protein
VTLIVALLFLTKLEIGSFKTKTAIYPLVWILIGVLGLRYYNALRGSNSAIKKSLLGLGLTVYILGTLFLSMGFFMCGEYEAGSSYTHKTNKSLTLVCRTYECYGTTGQCQLYTIRRITPRIKWVTALTSDKIDTTIWRR